jgi:hypothetical protein
MKTTLQENSPWNSLFLLRGAVLDADYDLAFHKHLMYCPQNAAFTQLENLPIHRIDI